MLKVKHDGNTNLGLSEQSFHDITSAFGFIHTNVPHNAFVNVENMDKATLFSGKAETLCAFFQGKPGYRLACDAKVGQLLVTTDGAVDVASVSRQDNGIVRINEKMHPAHQVLLLKDRPPPPRVTKEELATFLFDKQYVTFHNHTGEKIYGCVKKVEHTSGQTFAVTVFHPDGRETQHTVDFYNR